ncbi:MAG: ThiJ/PfpI protein [Ignavibacteria bacterium]|nr:ThiJ/PfpI protein [Ignavibacteria bacterium]
MSKGKIGVLIEDHFDQTEFEKFNEFFPKNGYEIEYLSHLWGNKELHFDSNPDNGVIGAHVTVSTEIDDVSPLDYKGILLIGAYATDRLRYQANPRKGEPNQAPAVIFLRNAVAEPNLKIGTICHSLWLFCADKELLKGKKVTCAHNIICDVENAGADVVFEGDQTAELVIDGNLITGKHPGMTDRFMEVFLNEIEKN